VMFQADKLSTAEFIMFIIQRFALTVVMILVGMELTAILVMRLFLIANTVII